MWKGIILSSLEKNEKENKKIKYFSSAELFKDIPQMKDKDIWFVDFDATEYMSFRKECSKT